MPPTSIPQPMTQNVPYFFISFAGSRLYTAIITADISPQARAFPERDMDPGFP